MVMESIHPMLTAIKSVTYVATRVECVSMLKVRFVDICEQRSQSTTVPTEDRCNEGVYL
jgi:hypothetical protein